MNIRLNLLNPVFRISFLLLAGSGLARAAPVQLAFWNPIQIYNAETDIRGLAINLPYGCNRDVYGLDLGIVNRADCNCGGLQIGALNDAGFFHGPDAPGRLSGVQLSVLMNGAREANGLQAGALFNLVRGDMRGVQLSWLGNVVLGDSCGLQLGLGNFTLHEAGGAQLAMAIVAALNVAGRMDGAQVSVGVLALNHADSVSGLQLNVGLAGNHAVDVDGAQVAATCNLAAHVRGVQVGLVNYCRTLSGMQIGVINIVADGGLPVFPVVNAGF